MKNETLPHTGVEKMPESKGEKKCAIAAWSKHRVKFSFIMVGMVLLVAAATFLFAHSLRLQLYELRAVGLAQTMEKNVQIMNTVIDNEWDRLRYVSNELCRTPPATREELLARLSDYYNIDAKANTWRISAIDSEGRLYCWDKKLERWSMPEMLFPDCPVYQISIMDAQDNDGERLAFIYRLPETIRFSQDEAYLTHTVLIFDMNAFEEMLEVSSFEGNSFSYITEKNGTRLYHQQNQGQFITAYNILTALQKCDFLYGETYENLEKASQSDATYIAEIEREGERYFVSYAALSVNNWSLFLFVPEAYVSGNASQFLTLLIMEVCAIALLLIGMISAFVWSNSRQTLKKQQIAVDEAHRASQAKSVFLSHMSHDIRTPLNGIMGMCHIAKERVNDGAAMKDCIEKIELTSRQLTALINDVLDMSRIEQDKVEIHYGPVNLDKVIRTCAVFIETQVNEKGIVFEQDKTGIHHPLVSADSVILEKILTNILGNASKFTPAGGKISLRAFETDEEEAKSVYRFVIRDSGIGMSPEFLVHLFEPFSQEQSGSRTQYKGTGLGLSIVKSLIDKLGGEITVESIQGQGSTFTVSLPMKHVAVEDFPPDLTNEKPNLSGLRVLLVEDNELNRIIAKHILKECGLTVDIATNGALALERFQRSAPGDYSLIFMDLRMPVMDGLEASRKIRALDRADAANIPIIALTANAMSDDAKQTQQAGMNEHLGKPIELDKLYAVLRKYCPNAIQKPEQGK